MGNQMNSKGHQSFKLCKFDTQEDPLRTFQNFAASNSSHGSNISLNTDKKFIQVQNLKRQLYQLPEQKDLQSRHFQRPSQLLKQDKIGIQTKSSSNLKKKIKRILPEPQHKSSDQKPIPRQELLFNQRINQSFKFFKSLKTLHLFESTFNIKFPVLILNKNKQISSLRKKIHLQKQNNSLFFLGSQNSSQDEKKNEKEYLLAEEKYKWFELLEKIERTVTRIFETGRHQQCLKQIVRLDTDIIFERNHSKVRKLENFLNRLSEVNFEFLDMLYFQLLNPEKEHFNSNKTLSFNSNKTLSSKKNYHKKNKLPLIDVKQMMIREKERDFGLESYQNLKKQGMEIYTLNKVCFYILAGQNQHFLFQTYHQNAQDHQQAQLNPQQTSQFYPLNLPKNPILLEILLNRYNSFAELLKIRQLTVIILANQSKIQQINCLAIKHLRTWSRINLIVLKQAEMPCLSLDGNLLLIENIEKEKEIRKCSSGTGDLWDLLRDCHNSEGLQYLIDNQFDYIEVIGTQNCLEQCFDCFMLGYMKSNQLDWGAKVVEPCNQLSQLVFKKSQNLQRSNQSKYLEKDCVQEKSSDVPFERRIDFGTFEHETLFSSGEVGVFQIINKHEQDYREKVRQIVSDQREYWTFTNHSIFRVDFIRNKILNQKWKQTVCFKKLVIDDQLTNSKIVLFQKNLTDIFNPFLTYAAKKSPDPANDYELAQSQFQNPQNYMLFKYQRDQNYYPLLYRENYGIFDIQGASRAISKKCLHFLDISIQRYFYSSQSQFGNNCLKCYIDPHVSLEGEGLEQIKLEIERRINQVLTSKRQFNDCQDLNQKRKNQFNQHLEHFRQYYHVQKSIQFMTFRVLSSLKEILIERQIIDGFQQNNLQQSDNFSQDLTETINIQIR